MPSQKLASGENLLKGELAAAWNILEGSSGDYTDLGIARRFGAAAAAYSLRDIGAMNGKVVRVRRDSDDAEEDFSANQVASGALEDFVGSGNDGFVSIWYDQTGNGNNATQSDDSKEPKIVSSGTIIKNVKGFPALEFAFTPRTDLSIGLLISNLNSVSGYVVTQKDDGDTNVMAGFTQGVSSDDSRFYLPFYTGGTVPNLGYNDSAAKIAFGTTLTGTCNLYSAFSGDTNIEAFKNGSSVGTTALVDQDVTATDSKIGQLSNSFYLDGKISEIFITTQKLQDDAATINSDVTNYYNL